MAGERTLAQAIGEALAAEMEADPAVVLLGEEAVEGGLHGVTAGLARRFPGRVIEIAHDEGALVGAALGMALAGLRPVCEVLLADHLGLAHQQIAGELAPLRFATGGEFEAPVVVRVPYGRGARGGPRQSACPEATFANVPGLTIVCPSTPADAHALLRAAVGLRDPVLFLEPRALYQSARGPLDGGVELGRARVARPGSQVTAVAWGACVPMALEAAARAEREGGLSVEVLDLATLVPWDQATVLASVARTGRAVVVQEAPRTGGFGAEVAAAIAEGALEWLQAPVLRVGAADAPVPWRGEDVGAVDAGRVFEALVETVAY